MPQTRYRNADGHTIEWDGYKWNDITPQVDTGFAVDPIHGPDIVADRQVFANEAKRLAAERDALGRQMPNRANLDRFDAINESVSTGPGRAIPGIGPMMQSFSPGVQELAGITSGLQGQARPVGSGSTSDFEQRLYRQGVPSPEKAGPANANITTYMRSVMDAEGDRVAFNDAFMRKNGTLNGAGEAWGKYLAANPYTVRENGRERPNRKRLPWREFFRVDAAPVGQAQRGTSRANPVRGLDDVAIQALPEGTWAVSPTYGILRVGARKAKPRPGPPSRPAARAAPNDGWSVQAH